MLHSFEFIGMVLSMIGAWYAIGTNHKENLEAKGKGFMFFALSNLSMMIFAYIAGFYALMIQMFIFNISSVLGLYKFNTKKVSIPIISLAIVVWITIIYQLVYHSHISLESMNITEVSAAIIAIIGAYVYLSKQKFWINVAFICYFVADILYVYVAYEKEFIFFGILSAFFVFTSTRGAYYVNFKKTK